MASRTFRDPFFYVFFFVTILTFVAALTFSEIHSDIGLKINNMKLGLFNPYREFNVWINDIFFGILNLNFVPRLLREKLGEDAGYYISSYLRDLVAGTLVYWITAGLWHITIYHIYVDEMFHKKAKPLPTKATIIDQMQLAQASILVYAGLPILSELLIENNLTQAYFYIDQVGGWGWYFLYLAMYMTFVEISIYWVHRTLHTNKFLYKYIHGLHHKYNRENTLTPWASIAFNPIDGIMQASPYVLGLFFIPVHYFTHVSALFLTGVWATYIHDAANGHIDPIMGAKYHTIHHTHYHYNFGQV